MSATLLEFREMDVFYGPIQVLKKISLQVSEDETASLTSAGDTGKSALLMSIFGQSRAATEQALYYGQNIRQRSAHYMASNDITQSPGGRRMFLGVSVEENLLMDITLIGMNHAEEDTQRTFGPFPRLKERRGQRTMAMSGGEQQMLIIARALMSWSKLLLSDEPPLSLAPVIVRQVFQTLRELARGSMTIFLVEQNANHAPKLSDCAYVMVTEEIRMSGSDEELLGNQEVRNTYFGGY